MSQPPTEKIVRAGQHRKGLLHNIWHHDLAERLRMRRKDEAMHMQLGNEYDVGTYPQSPGSQMMVVNNGGGWVKGALMALAMAVGITGAAAGLGLFVPPLARAPGALAPGPQPVATPSWEGYYVDVEVAPDGSVTTKLVDEDGNLIRELD